MKIALYSSHHGLPFWGEGSQPDCMFDAEILKDYTLKTSNEGDVPVHETWIWPILVGLSLIDLPTLAHVSMGFVDGKVIYPKRMWVQITTLPEERDEKDFPLVVRPFKQGKNVKHLWGGDNGTYSPWQFDDVKPIPEEERLTPAFWKFFFEKKLHDEMDVAIATAKKASEDARQLTDLYGAVT